MDVCCDPRDEWISDRYYEAPRHTEVSTFMRGKVIATCNDLKRWRKLGRNTLDIGGLEFMPEEAGMIDSDEAGFKLSF